MPSVRAAELNLAIQMWEICPSLRCMQIFGANGYIKNTEDGTVAESPVHLDGILGRS